MSIEKNARTWAMIGITWGMLAITLVVLTITMLRLVATLAVIDRRTRDQSDARRWYASERQICEVPS